MRRGVHGFFLLLILVSATPARGEGTGEALVHLKKGIQLYDAEDFQSAYQEFTLAQSLAPERANPYRWLGMTAAHLGDCKAAVGYLDEFLKRIPAGDARVTEASAVRDGCQARLALPTGGVVIQSEPPGAEVRLDREDSPMLGRTPFEREGVLAGAHLLHLRLAGHRPIVQGLTVTTGSRVRVRAVLEPLGKGGRKRPDAPGQEPAVTVATERAAVTGLAGGRVGQREDDLGGALPEAQPPRRPLPPLRPVPGWVRPTGYALTIGGAALLVGGILAMTLGRDPRQDADFYFQVMSVTGAVPGPQPTSTAFVDMGTAFVVLGALGAATGAVMLGIHYGRMDRWILRRFYSWQLAPVATDRYAGLSFAGVY